MQKAEKREREAGFLEPPKAVVSRSGELATVKLFRLRQSVNRTLKRKIKPEIMHLLDSDTDKRSCKAAIQMKIHCLGIGWLKKVNHRFPKMAEGSTGCVLLEVVQLFKLLKGFCNTIQTASLQLCF